MIVDRLELQVLFAIIGGFAAELLHWYGLARRPGAIAKYRTRPLYWFTTLGMIAIGGVMPLLYIQNAASALLCFHLGAATPLLLQKLIANLPDAVVTQGEGGASLRDFFRG
jgi:hypothetical protein